jgi:Enoyl-(Acyl carrier protein) reductase
MPESPTIKDGFEPRAKASGMTWEQFLEFLASKTHARRLMKLEEVANMAVFMASDKASGMTGTTVNLTMGSLDDWRRVVLLASSVISHGSSGRRITFGARAPRRGSPGRCASG